MAISYIGYWLKNTIESELGSGTKRFIAVSDDKSRRLYKIHEEFPLPGPRVVNLSFQGSPLDGGRVPFGRFRFVLDLSKINGQNVLSKWFFSIEATNGKTILGTEEGDEHRWCYAEMSAQFTLRGTANQILNLKSIVAAEGFGNLTAADVLSIILNPGASS